MSLPIRMRIRITVGMGARMFHFRSDGVGEDIITITTATDITIGGIRGGIDKRAAVELTNGVLSELIPCSCNHSR